MGAWLWIALACSRRTTGDDPYTGLDTDGPDTGDSTEDTGTCVAGFAGFADRDGDGFGDPAAPLDCDPDAVADATDCDDGDAQVHPGADERCDQVDTDCDPATLEDGLVTWTDSSGVSNDVTSEFAAGTDDLPVELVLGDGRYDLCGGTWHVRLRSQGTTTTVDGHGTTLLDGSGTGSVFAVDGGALDLVGLSVTRGEGSIPSGAGSNDLTGGGLACFGAAVVNVTSSTFFENTAFVGGAWFVSDCVLTGTSVTLENNTATYGGGVYTFGGEVALVDSVVVGNVANNSGGGLGVEGVGPRPTLVLTDTIVADNLASFGGGLVVYENADATCVGTPGVDGGFFRNTGEVVGGGIYLTGADFVPAFTAQGCDFGVGADDNVPTDVVTAYDTTGVFAWGDDASFVCDPAGCL